MTRFTTAEMLGDILLPYMVQVLVFPKRQTSTYNTQTSAMSWPALTVPASSDFGRLQKKRGTSPLQRQTCMPVKSTWARMMSPRWSSPAWGNARRWMKTPASTPLSFRTLQGFEQWMLNSLWIECACCSSSSATREWCEGHFGNLPYQEGCSAQSKDS